MKPSRLRDLHQPISAPGQPAAPVADRVAQAVGRLGNQLHNRNLDNGAKACGEAANDRRKIISGGQLHIQHKRRVAARRTSPT